MRNSFEPSTRVHCLVCRCTSAYKLLVYVRACGHRLFPFTIFKVFIFCFLQDDIGANASALVLNIAVPRCRNTEARPPYRHHPLPVHYAIPKKEGERQVNALLPAGDYNFELSSQTNAYRYTPAEVESLQQLRTAPLSYLLNGVPIAIKEPGEYYMARPAIRMKSTPSLLSANIDQRCWPGFVESNPLYPSTHQGCPILAKAYFHGVCPEQLDSTPVLEYIHAFCMGYIADITGTVQCPWHADPNTHEVPHPLPRPQKGSDEKAYQQLPRIMNFLCDAVLLLKHHRFHGRRVNGSRREIRNAALLNTILAELPIYAEFRKIAIRKELRAGAEAAVVVPQLWYPTVQFDWAHPPLRKYANQRKGLDTLKCRKEINVRKYALVDSNAIRPGQMQGIYEYKARWYAAVRNQHTVRLLGMVKFHFNIPDTHSVCW